MSAVTASSLTLAMTTNPSPAELAASDPAESLSPLLSSDDVVFYPVTVSLDTAPDGVGVGATAGLSVTTGTATGVLKAATQAITTTGNRSTVTVRRDGVDTATSVRIGVSGPTETEIISGVAEGDILVLPTPATTSGGSGAGFPRTGGGR
jgi:hypothetical protein